MSRKKHKGKNVSVQKKNITAIGNAHKQVVENPFPESGKKNVFEKPGNLAVLILVLTFIAFYPSLKNDFVTTWDDNNYVTQNPRIQSLNGANVKLMFTRQVNGTYVPLPLLTYAVEFKLFGKDPAPYHRTNLIIHLLSTLLIFQLFRLLKLDLIYAAFGALLFGIHPMRVESVAWISERKDVLYVLFYIAALLCYVRNLSTGKKRSSWFWLSILFALLSLLSKIEAVTLPLTMLLIDYLLERPLKFRLVKEKIPFFALSLLFGGLGIVIILWVNRKAGLLKINEMIGFGDRIIYGIYALNGYVVKFFAPVRQSAIYPYPEFSGFAKTLFYILNPLLLVALIYFVYKSTRFTRVIVFGTLVFLCSIIFLLQIFAVGNGFFADRYTYIPYAGFIFIIAWLGNYLVKKRENMKFLVLPAMVLISAIFIGVTFSRCKIWKNDETLWTKVIEYYPEELDWPYANRAVFYINTGQKEKALSDLDKAIRINPQSETAYSNRGMLYGLNGEYQKAVSDFTMAYSIDPGNIKSLNNRGVSYGNLGKPDSAIADFSKVISIDPQYSSAFLNLANVYFRTKDYNRAIAACSKGIGNSHQKTEFLDLMGNCYLEKAENDSAMQQFTRCLDLDGSDFEALAGMAVAFYEKKDNVNARRYLQQAQQANNELTFGVAGLRELEKSGYFFGEKKKESLEKMFSDLK